MSELYRYGAVLLLDEEQMSEELHAACAAMRSLAMNTVVIWPPVFYRNGAYCFRRQRELLAAAAAEGLDVIVELHGQVPNLEFYPDFLPVDEVMVRNADGTPAPGQNGLGELNYNHPAVRREMKRFLEAAAAALRSHPALAGWDIWNESHFLSYDPWTLAEFRRFLERKYGTIDELNRVWKKSYTDFSQLRIDPVLWASIMPEVDLQEFRTANLAERCAEWTRILKAADPDHFVIADNVMSNAVWSEFDRGTDDWKLAKAVDRFGISFYPKTGGRLLRDNAPWLRALTFDAAAAAGGGTFLVSEMQSHYYSELFTAERVSPEELTCWNLEALMHGACGCIYWKWSPFKTGLQLGGRGLTLADGSFSPRAGAVKRFGELLRNHPDLHCLKPAARAALLYDRTANFMVKAVNAKVRHIIGDDQPAEARFGVYRRAFERNIPLEILTPETLELDGISVLFLPYAITLDDRTAETLREFVRSGGTLVANYPFGDFDGEGRLRREIPGGPLHDLVGAKHLDIDDGGCELLEPAEDCTVLSERPFLSLRSFGRGLVCYAGAPVWNGDGHDDTCRKIFDLLTERHPELVAVRANLPVARARGLEAEYLFVADGGESSCCEIELAEPFSAELLFGEGELLRDGNRLRLNGAKNALLRLRPETPPLPPLLRLGGNRVWRSYLGGRTLDQISGIEPPQDGHFPEEWLLSDTAAVNPGRAPEGITPVRLGGKTVPLTELFARAPEFLLGEAHRRRFGEHAGVLVKYLDSAIRLQLQCHPTVEFAKRFLHSDSGKTEGYCILGTRPGADAAVYLGFQRPPSKEQFRRMIETQDIDAMLGCFDRIPVRPGDLFLVPGGLPHAIGEGVFMIEIMEPTDFVVRLEFERYGCILPEEARFMGRDVDFALSMFDFTAYPVDEVRRRFFVRPRPAERRGESLRSVLFDRSITDRFRMEKFDIRGKAAFSGEGLRLLIVTAGGGTLRAGGTELALRRFDRVLVPAGTPVVEFESTGGMELIQAAPPAP